MSKISQERLQKIKWGVIEHLEEARKDEDKIRIAFYRDLTEIVNEYEKNRIEESIKILNRI